MSIRFGPIDPLQLIFGVINYLIEKGTLTFDEGEQLIKSSLDPSLSEEEKEKIINSLRGENNPRKKKDGQ